MLIKYYNERHKALLAGSLIQREKFQELLRNELSHKALLAGSLIQSFVHF